MPTDIESLDDHEVQLLQFLVTVFGNRTKSKIRHAWETGDYSGMLLKSGDDAILQQLRIRLGPSWLFGLKWKEIRHARPSK